VPVVNIKLRIVVKDIVGAVKGSTLVLAHGRYLFKQYGRWFAYMLQIPECVVRTTRD
jgi:hypothetical protein